MTPYGLAVEDRNGILSQRTAADGNGRVRYDAARCSRRRELYFGAIVGESPAMHAMYDMIERVAPTDATVLVTGESGVGKELVAQAIHQHGPRRNAPCIAINCGSVPETLIDSELFGHEAGSFTGATRTRAGLFERANGGTLFLDEIAEMPLDLQTRLLRVLETGVLRHVGGEREIEVDVRVIAATNRDPIKAVAEGRLREDLMYRLSVFPIQVPPLREREDDLEILADHFLAELNDKNTSAKRFSHRAMDVLKSYSWPGNVRQLKNVVHRAFIMADDVIDVDCLPERITGRTASNSTGALALPVGTTIAEAERQLIRATLDYYKEDKKRTAEALGISLKTLYNRLNAYRELEGR